MYLSREEERMLDGEFGAGTQKAMEMIVALGDIFSAERLTEISSAHLLSSFKSHDVYGIEWIEELVEKGARSRPWVTTTKHCGSVDPMQWREMGVTEELMTYQTRLDKCYMNFGAIPLGSCVPYLLGNAPRFGQHFSWGGSSGGVYANSILGARGNREGSMQNVAAAATGKTPLCGLLLDENRFGNVLIKTKDLDLKSLSFVDYAAMGYYIGKKIVDKIPVFTDVPRNATVEQLRGIAYSVAVGGAVAMFHCVGLTPEAPTLEKAFGGQEPEEKLTIGPEEIKETYEQLCTTGGGKVDAVVFGCPHCTINEIKEVASLLEGRKVHRGVRLWVGTSMQIKEVAKRMGLVDAIEKAGGLVITDTCCAPSIPLDYVEGGVDVAATDSIKTAFYVPGTCKVDVLLGSPEDCINAAVTGEWR